MSDSVNPLVSVIVPVYNAEPYLDRCIQSILAQTYTNFELILVNDGSTDRSEEICASYQAQNPDKIRLLNRQNGGLSSARNEGLACVGEKSEYVCFIDSDDVVARQYLEFLLLPMNKVDISIRGFQRTREEMCQFPSYLDSSYEVVDDFKNQLRFYELLRQGVVNSACSKLYKTDIIQQHSLRFNDLEVCEDIDFNLRYLDFCQMIAYSDVPVYGYIDRGGSLSTQATPVMFDNYFGIHRYLLDNYSEQFVREIDTAVYRQYESLAIRFTRMGKSKQLRPYISNPLIQQACRSFKPQSWFERCIRFALQNRSTLLLRLFVKLASLR